MVNRSDADVCRKRTRKVMQVVWIQNVIALCLIVERCNGNHFIGPSNETVAEGTRATLRCQTSPSKTVWWRYSENDVFYANAISYSYQSSYEAEVDASQGIYNLIIRNASSSYAGLYTCIDDDGGGERRSAWLIVTVAAIETTPNPSAENNTPRTVGIVVGILVGLFVVIITIIFCKRRSKRCQHNASEDNLKSTVEKEKEEEEEPFMTTGSPSEEQTNFDHAIDILNGDTREHTPEPLEDRREDLSVSTEKTDQKKAPACSTSTEIEEIESPTTSSHAANNSQTASSVLHTPKDEKSQEPTPEPQEDRREEPSVSTENTRQNSTTTGVKEIEQPTTGGDVASNSQTASSVSSPPKDEKQKLAETTKADKSIVESEENSSKNEAIVSPGMQDPDEKKKQPPPPPPKPLKKTNNEISPASNAEQAGFDKAIDDRR